MSERRPERSLYDWVSSSTTIAGKAVTSRPDTATAALVERAIFILKTEGLQHASRFLEENGVPIDVAARVLLRPAERRRLKKAEKTRK